jgi:zinc transporter ZupT
LWIVRVVAIVVDLILVIGGGGVIFLIFLALASFVAWACIQSIQIVKFLVDLSLKSTRRFLRSLFYLLVAVGYGIYLGLMSYYSSNSPASTGIDQTVLDWLLSIAIFFFSLAGMGQYFFKDVRNLGEDLRGLPWQKDWKLRNAVLSILFLSVGYQLFLRGLPVILPLVTFGGTAQAYYLVQMLFFVPLAIIGIVFTFAKHSKKSSKDAPKTNKKRE